MQSILLAVALGLGLSALGTPFLINALVRHGIGSQPRVDGVQAHLKKRGTPTLGGAMVLAAATVAYALAHMSYGEQRFAFHAPSAAGLIALGTMWTLGAVGAWDDLVSATRSRSLGLSPTAKTICQGVVSIGLTIAVLRWAHMQPHVSWAGEILLRLPVPLFAVWVFVLVWVFSNGVNIVDGTDGLATGSSSFALFVYLVIGFWEFRHAAVYGHLHGVLDTTILTAAVLGACVGFLWWNAPPARIILGDAGAMALGGLLVSLALVSQTQLLLPVVGALFVADYASSLIQIAFFKLTKRVWPHPNGGGRRVFAMAPVHHHFEMKGWPEITVTIRFWLIAGLLGSFGLALFYMHFLKTGAGGEFFVRRVASS
jgi:phospho-N-acetylmuramoyl-pentapeptide-transferase